MAIGSGLNFATKSIKSPLSDFATRLDSFGSNMVAQADKDELLKQEKERLAIQDARQASQDAQNKQLFDLKMEDAAMAKKKIADKSAFLKGIAQADAYGLKYGTNDIVNRLGQYSGDNPEAKAALAAGPGTAEYDNYFKKMEALGNNITSNSYEDRVMGFSTANPSNEYAAEEAIKANIARASALDKEIKSVGDNKLKYDLEMLKQVGKSDTKSSSSTGKTAGGYSVKDPGTVAKDAYTLFKNAYGKKSGDKINSTVNEQIAIMANAGYDSAQIAKAVTMGFTPGKSKWYWFDKDSKFDSDKAKQAVGAPRNVAVETATTNAAYTAGLGNLISSYDDRLKSLKEQKDGKVGMSMLDSIINGTSTKPTVNDVVNKANEVSGKGSNKTSKGDIYYPGNTKKGEYPEELLTETKTDWSKVNGAELIKTYDLLSKKNNGDGVWNSKLKEIESEIERRGGEDFSSVKEEVKKVVEKNSSDSFSKLNNEDIQIGIDVYEGAEKEAYLQEKAKREALKDLSKDDKIIINNLNDLAEAVGLNPDKSLLKTVDDFVIKHTYNKNGTINKKGTAKIIAAMGGAAMAPSIARAFFNRGILSRAELEAVFSNAGRRHSLGKYSVRDMLTKAKNPLDSFGKPVISKSPSYLNVLNKTDPLQEILKRVIK